MEKVLGTNFIVTNITGASGAIGLEHARSRKPDGYTLAYMPVESTMLRALGFTDLSCADFKFICRVMTIPATVTVRADSEWKTFEDLLAYAKAQPEKIQTGNSGTGSIWHVAAASLEEASGAKFTHVPFEGAAPAVAALVGKNIQMVTVSPSEVKSNVDSGELKILAVLGEARSSVFPDVKTARELGVDLALQAWGGFAVPKGTPEDVVKILEDAAKTAANSEALKKLLKERGFDHAYLSGDEMDKRAAAELEHFGNLIPKLGIAN